MSQQQESSSPKNECFFYFRYQMKLEFIPYIEEEIEYFIDLCEDQVHQSGVWERIMKVLNKRIADLDIFFNKNWNDYRAQQILRSRKLLVEFCKKYNNLYNKNKPIETTTIKKSAIVEEKKPQFSKVQIISQQQQKGVVLESLVKEKSVDKNKISWQKLPKNKIISSILTPKNQKSKEIHSSSFRRSEVNEVKSIKMDSNQKSRVSSTSSDNVKMKVISPKIIPKTEVYTKKLTKQEYIAYLRTKNAQV